MRTAIAAILLVLTAFDVMAPAADMHAERIQTPAKPDRSVSQGVYTEAQQKRGEPFYVRECSTCHGETLKGGEGTRPLTGPEFLDRWNGLSVGHLFDNIRQTMPPPPDRPGKLTPQETVDVIAYMLKVNKFPVGADTELPTDVAALKQILITAPPPR